jgi:DNA-binding transcriptional ArsR family regulator
LKHRDAFVAIADPTRRQILELLRERGAMTAGEIASQFRDAARPGISRHLRVLRESDLVHVRAAGRTRRYRLNAKPLAELHTDWLAPFADFHTESLAELRRRVEAKNP